MIHANIKYEENGEEMKQSKEKSRKNITFSFSNGISTYYMLDSRIRVESKTNHLSSYRVYNITVVTNNKLTHPII